MAELRDHALRMVGALLAGREPEPLGLDLWSHSPDGAARLVEAVIEECSDAGVALARVRVDPCVAVAMRAPAAGRSWSYRGTVLEVDATLFQRVEFHRSPRR
jgi:hypothetical protein